MSSVNYSTYIGQGELYVKLWIKMWIYSQDLVHFDFPTIIEGRIQRFLDRMYKSGFLTEQDTDIERQMTAADDNLLRAVVRNERHVF